jgi:hypothetical protein
MEIEKRFGFELLKESTSRHRARRSLQIKLGRNVMAWVKVAIVATLASCFLLGFDPVSEMAPSLDIHLEIGTGPSAARIGSGLAVTLRLEAAVLENIPLTGSDLGQQTRSLLSEAIARIL